MEEKKLKILHLVSTSEGANWLYRIASIQKRDGHNVKVAVCTAPKKESRLIKRLQESQIPYLIIDISGSKIKNLFRILKNSFKLFFYIKSERFDVVHYHLLKAIIVGRIVSYITKVPVRVSQWPGYAYANFPLFLFLDKLTYKMDSIVIASSKYTKDLLIKKGFRGDKITVIYYGTDINRLTYSNEKALSFKKEWGLEDFKVVGMVAYMYKPLKDSQKIGIKGHEYFIQAAKIVLEKRNDVKFVIVGDELVGVGSYRKSLEKMTENLSIKDNVIFTGFIEDVQKPLSAMDIVCVPSVMENLGGVTEPLIMGKPVIASNTGGIPEAIIHEKTGLLFNVGDVQGLANSTIRLLENHEFAKELGRNGREYIKAFMNVEKTTKEIERTYHKILSTTIKNSNDDSI